MQAFLQKLVLELKRGGKKTIFLSVLLIAGSYFWIPMLWNALAPSSTATATAGADAAPVSSTSAAMGPTAATPVRSSGAPASADETPRVATDWRVIRQRLQTLPVFQPVGSDEWTRDPFDQAWMRHDTAEAELSEPEPARAPEPPAARLVLSSTLVGSRIRGAIINNKVYRVGQEIDESNHAVVKDILPDRVLLERNGEEVWVEVSRN